MKFKKFHSAFHPNFRFQLSQQQPEIKNSQVIKCIWSPWILMLLLRVWIYEFVRNDIARVFCSMKKTCGRVGRQRGWGEKNFNRLSPCFFLFKGSYFFKHCNFYVEHMLIKLENNVWRYCFSTRILKVTRYYYLYITYLILISKYSIADEIFLSTCGTRNEKDMQIELIIQASLKRVIFKNQ